MPRRMPSAKQSTPVFTTPVHVPDAKKVEQPKNSVDGEKKAGSAQSPKREGDPLPANASPPAVGPRD
jgi:hypothetical protein